MNFVPGLSIYYSVEVYMCKVEILTLQCSWFRISFIHRFGWQIFLKRGKTSIDYFWNIQFFWPISLIETISTTVSENSYLFFFSCLSGKIAVAVFLDNATEQETDFFPSDHFSYFLFHNSLHAHTKISSHLS